MPPSTLTSSPCLHSPVTQQAQQRKFGEGVCLSQPTMTALTLCKTGSSSVWGGAGVSRDFPPAIHENEESHGSAEGWRLGCATYRGLRWQQAQRQPWTRRAPRRSRGWGSISWAGLWRDGPWTRTRHQPPPLASVPLWCDSSACPQFPEREDGTHRHLETLWPSGKREAFVHLGRAKRKGSHRSAFSSPTSPQAPGGQTPSLFVLCALF